MKDDFRYEDTRFGFKWGPMGVVRITSDPKYGVVIGIETPTDRVDVRSTPSGRLRVGKVARRKVAK